MWGTFEGHGDRHISLVFLIVSFFGGIIRWGMNNIIIFTCKNEHFNYF